MDMPSVTFLDSVWMTVAGAASATALVLVGRLLARGVTAVHRGVQRHVPARVAATPMTVGLVALTTLLVGGLMFAGLNVSANSFFGAHNERTEAGITQPSSAKVSGSPASLVSWDSLGRTGRDFVAEATSPEELARFHGADARPVEPVRVYAGVRSADTLQERADLAVRELERAGGFDRAVLAVWVPTGSGWMIPEAAEALEQLYAGDTAIVGMQYSYLPSLLSVFLDPGLAARAGAVLFNTVAAHWSHLPAASRPKLLLFAKSLGTAGVEAPFAVVDATSSLNNLTARTDGALIVGAKYLNPILSQLTDERDSGSPVWQPVFDGGRTVRFLNRDPAPQHQPSASWTGPRVVYLQHPSDPVPFWGVERVVETAGMDGQAARLRRARSSSLVPDRLQPCRPSPIRSTSSARRRASDTTTPRIMSTGGPPSCPLTGGPTTTPSGWRSSSTMEERANRRSEATCQRASKRLSA